MQAETLLANNVMTIYIETYHGFQIEESYFTLKLLKPSRVRQLSRMKSPLSV